MPLYTYERSVVVQIASALAAISNCEKSGNVEWRDRWQETIESLMKDCLPSGSGFDAGTKLDWDTSRPDRLVFNTSFHHMDDNGSYCGWSEHSVIAAPSFVHTVEIRVTGRNVRDIKGYIADMFHHCLVDKPPQYQQAV